MRDMVIQVVVLGTGDPFTENFFRWLHGAYPEQRRTRTSASSPELAHLIEAGSDFFLMPSLYEPCGLNQMYSSLYGALPIVRATGGLDDTVENYDEATGTGTGFKFWEISGRALFYTIGWAVSTWYDRPHHYAAMQQQGMAPRLHLGASRRSSTRRFTITRSRIEPRCRRSQALTSNSRESEITAQRRRRLKNSGGCKQPPPKLTKRNLTKPSGGRRRTCSSRTSLPTSCRQRSP